MNSYRKPFCTLWKCSNYRFTVLVAFDSNATLLAIGANQTLIGKNYFGYEVQQFIDQNRILNNLTRILLAGNSGYGVYDYGQGERLITAYPIFVNGEPKYFLQKVTSTKEIYAQLESPFLQRIRLFSFLTGTTAAVIAVLIALLAKWNVIFYESKQKKERTRELEKLYDDIKQYWIP